MVKLLFSDLKSLVTDFLFIIFLMASVVWVFGWLFFAAGPLSAAAFYSAGEIHAVQFVLAEIFFLLPWVFILNWYFNNLRERAEK